MDNGQTTLAKPRKAVVGETTYRVGWRDAVPYIETGKIVLVGPRQRTRRVQLKNGRLVNAAEWSPNIKHAIEEAIYLYARRCLPHITMRRQGHPWEMVVILTKLRRLFIKLERHHLVGIE